MQRFMIENFNLFLAKFYIMNKITLLFALLSCLFGSAQIIEFQNLELKNYLLSANSTSKQIASTETATFNYEFARQTSSTSAGYNNYPQSNSFFQFDNYHSIDTNNDGEIQLNEAAAITYLNLDHFYFSEDNNSNDEHYLEYFKNLKYLGLSGAHYPYEYDEFDLSLNTSLEMLNISDSDINNLNISQNVNLTHFVANDVINNLNNVNSQNMVSLPNLKFLAVRGSAFAQDLNLPQSTLLEELYCVACQDNTIDFSLLPSLKNLVLHGVFPSLDFSTNNLLENVIIDNQ
jgi:hypothetical protein